MGRIIKALIFAPILVARSPFAIEAINPAPLVEYKQTYLNPPPNPHPLQVQQQNAFKALLSLPSYRLENIAQPTDNFSLLYQQAPQAQYQLECFANEVATTVNGMNIYSSGIKNPTRAQEKVRIELSDHAEKLTDLVRITLEANSISSLLDIFDSISETTKIFAVANRFSAPEPSGYRDLKLLVQIPNSRLIGEVQLHLSSISKIKNGAEHQSYIQIQTIQRNAIANNRALLTSEKHRIDSLRNESNQLYNAALLKHLSFYQNA